MIHDRATYFLRLSADRDFCAGARPCFSTFDLPPLERFRGYFEHIYQRQLEHKARTGQYLGCFYSAVGLGAAKQHPEIARKVQEILGNYAAPLNAVPAAADLTHIIELGSTSVSRNGQVTVGPEVPGMVAGTQMSKILSIVGSSWSLVTGGLP